jgi:hypothetical protein
MITNSQLRIAVLPARAHSPHRTIRRRSQGRRQVGATERAAVVHLEAYSDWTVQEKRQYLGMLSERVWDIEDELARTRTERAMLMNNLRTDLNQAG